MTTTPRVQDETLGASLSKLFRFTPFRGRNLYIGFLPSFALQGGPQIEDLQPNSSVEALRPVKFRESRNTSGG